ncbi:MAG: hypothetical protein ACI8PT_004476, partial [Gammaproteobacteria bacterium]
GSFMALAAGLGLGFSVYWNRLAIIPAPFSAAKTIHSIDPAP